MKDQISLEAVQRVYEEAQTEVQNVLMAFEDALAGGLGIHEVQEWERTVFFYESRLLGVAAVLALFEETPPPAPPRAQGGEDD